MCADLWTDPAAREILQRLTASLGDDLERLTTTMSDSELSSTFHAQRAIHAHHLGHYFAYRARQRTLTLSGAVGHSVGIAAALVACESISIEDSGRFISVRARLLRDICTDLRGREGLAAVSTDDFDGLIEEIDAFPGISLALRNSITKGAIGGPIASLEAFANKLAMEGWPARLTFLNVEGPFHTVAFSPAQEQLRRVLATIPIRPPAVPLFMGTSGCREHDPARIRQLLIDQLCSAERHFDAMRAAYRSGCRRFLEVAFQPQLIHWVSDQLVDETGTLLPDVETTAVATSDLASSC
jgi:[acyl-carrier-protein] S-malonyltransferase